MKCAECGEELKKITIGNADAWKCKSCGSWEYSSEALELMDKIEDDIKAGNTIIWEKYI